MFGGNKELSKYVLKAIGISRTALNIWAFIGMFIIGWLIAFVFSMLGKGRVGCAYLIPIWILAFMGRLNDEPLVVILSVALYIAAWVHANVVLSRYESAARQRITEIDRQGKADIDSVLEKGLLQSKVLRKGQSAIDVLTGALQMPGGDPSLLNLAGVVMSANKRYKEAAEFFDRALASAKDKSLIKQIKKNRASMDKKIA